MHGGRRGDVLGAAIAEPWRIDAGEKVFAGSEEDRGNGKVHLVDESGAEILPDRRHAAAEADVPAAGGFAARFSAAWIPSVTKWKVVSPAMATGARLWLVSTKTGVW